MIGMSLGPSTVGKDTDKRCESEETHPYGHQIKVVETKEAHL